MKNKNVSALLGAVEKMKNVYLAHKVATLVTIAVVAMGAIGGTVYGVSIHNKNSVDAEVSQQLSQIDYTEAYKTAQMQVENSILSDEDYQNYSSELATYEDCLKDMSDKKASKFVLLLDDIEKAYLASEQVITDSISQLSEVYPTEEGFYDDTFNASKDALLEQINAFVDEGKYKEAATKFNELNTLYSAYVSNKGVDVAADISVNSSKVSDTKKKVSSSYSNVASNTSSGNTASSSSNNSSSNNNGASSSSSSPSNSGNTSSSNSSSSSSSTTKECSHNWVQKGVVHHDETYKTVDMGFDYPVYNKTTAFVCLVCGNVYYNENESYAHWESTGHSCGYYAAGSYQIGTAHQSQIVQQLDKEAYDDTSNAYYECSKCGKRK